MNFSIVETVDFIRLLNQLHQPADTHSYPRSFTTSACGHYVLVIVDREIFVYDLYDPVESLRPVVRIVACRSVLAVSMDTSSGRNSVAALLEGRLGASWDLNSIIADGIAMTQVGEPLDLGMRTHIQGLAPLGAAKPIPMEGLDRAHAMNPTPAEQPQIGEEETIESIHGTVAYRTESPGEPSMWLDRDLERASEVLAFSDHNEIMPSPLEIITRPTGTYSNLGTSSDNPRSVAICPQRKCVAYGCRSGIELHWIDQTTGSSLNRWFPLAAPSDHLYFLPQRIGFGSSTKKLRLISSAGGPLQLRSQRRDSAPTRWRFRSSHSRHGRMQSMTRLFFGSLPFPSALGESNTSGQEEDGERQGVLRTVDCDHYLAVPLSDGVNVLFTCPATGLLCLGSDAPLGGPTKLMRKVCMVPPASDVPERAAALTCYRAGADLRWGVRIAAAYDDGRVILYSIPADCFERIQYIRSTPDVWDELAGVVGQSDLLMDVFMAEQHDVNEADCDTEGAELSRQSSDSSSSSKSFRSLQIDGAVIYEAKTEIDDLQVDCTGGGIKVWIFLRNSTAVRMSIYTPRHFIPDARYVGADGLLRNVDETHLQRDDHLKNASAAGKGKQRSTSNIST